MNCVRWWVSGRVQGVSFRAATRAQALALGLSGLVRNLPDGRVEVLACGEPESLRVLSAWLRHGPPGASVSGLEYAEVDEVAPRHFTIVS